MAKFPAYPNLRARIRRYPIATGQTFLEGAFVYLDTNGDLVECGTDPATILGVALHDAGALPETTNCLVACAVDGHTYVMMGSSDPVQADEGIAYGIIKDADGIWTVDKTDTSNTRIRVEKVYTFASRNQFEVSVLAANVQLPG